MDLARLQSLSNDQVRILIANGMFNKDGPWWCKLEFKLDGTKIEIEAFGPTLEEAVDGAITRLDALRGGISPRPMIEAQPIIDPTVHFTDDLPF